jgi:hypothetical protein
VKFVPDSTGSEYDSLLILLNGEWIASFAREQGKFLTRELLCLTINAQKKQANYKYLSSK